MNDWVANAVLVLFLLCYCVVVVAMGAAFVVSVAWCVMNGIWAFIPATAFAMWLGALIDRMQGKQ